MRNQNNQKSEIRVREIKAKLREFEAKVREIRDNRRKLRYKVREIKNELPIENEFN